MDSRRIAGCLSTALALASVSGADTANITIYSNGFGLVSETRTLDFAKGLQTVPFEGVSQHIEPSSVLFDAPGVNLLEQNYVYDLVDGNALLKRFLDKEITVWLKEGGEPVVGTLLSYSGDLVLQNAGGITSLDRGAVQAVKYPELPEGLRTRPALNWLIDARKAGPQDVTVTYTTGGMGWAAEYVCLLNEDDSAMELAAWVNLGNTTGTRWEKAGLQLVAGDLNRARPAFAPKNYQRMALTAEADMAGGFEEESFFEYHLYTLPRPVDLENNQDKEIALFDPVQTRVTKEYVYSSHGEGVQTRLRFDNRKGEGPGLPLPAGKVRLYKKDSGGRKQLIGEDNLKHTPVDEDIELTAGKAFDLVVERTVKDHRSFGRGYEMDIEFSVRNRKAKDDVTILLDEHLWGDWEVIKCSHPHVKKDANRARITVPVAAGQEQTVTLSVRGKH